MRSAPPICLSLTNLVSFIELQLVKLTLNSTKLRPTQLKIAAQHIRRGHCGLSSTGPCKARYSVYATPSRARYGPILRSPARRDPA